MIFKIFLQGKAPFFMTAILFASGCSSVPTDRIRSNPAPAVYIQPSHDQAAPSNAWPPVMPVIASIQIGSPDVMPSLQPVFVPVILPEVIKPAPVVVLPPVKKIEIKAEPVKPEPVKKVEPKKSEHRESKAVQNKNKPKSNFLNRFDGINWGDAPKPNMKVIEENKDALEPEVSAYTIDHDDAPAFGLKPGMIIYYFNRDGFHKVEVIWEPDEAEYRTLEKNVLESFGEPVEAEVLGSRRWSDTQAKLNIQFSDANATKARSPGYLMSLVVERIV